MNRDLGMFTVSLGELADWLTEEQSRVCAYGTRDGDTQRCDCKYGGHRGLKPWTGDSEQTGCPELRMAARLVRKIAEEEANEHTEGRMEDCPVCQREGYPWDETDDEGPSPW